MSRTSPDRQRERREWIERAEALQAPATEHAPESARLRTMAPPLVQTLADSGIFAMASPREVGGFDAHPATQVEVFETLARADVSTGWVAMIQAETAGMVGAHLPDGPGLDAVFNGQFPRIAGTANPEGRLEEAGGEYRVEGRWSFASGIRHCSWVLANAIIPAQEGHPPRVLGCVLPTSEIEIEDSWHVMGLEGTGSCHYRTTGPLSVPKDFLTGFGGPRPHRGGAWHDLPTIVFLSPGHTGIALGAAQRALDLIAGQLAERVRFGAGSAIIDRGAFQRDYAEAVARLRAARAYALDTLDQAMAHREQGRQIDEAQSAQIRLMVAWVTDACVEIARFAHHSGGGAAAFQDNPLQQIVRDIMVASQHVYVADTAYERAGALLLNRKPPGVL